MKQTSTKVIEALFLSRLMPLFYHDDLDICKSVIKSCYEGGARLFEFTHRGKNAQKNFPALKNWCLENAPDLFLGIGTVKDATTAEFYAKAGADFIVCPIIEETIAEICNNYNLPWVPGCMTPSEIARAEKAGATLVKLFPGELLGPAYLQSIKPLFQNLHFMVTGGVTTEKENLQGWIMAGAKAVGMGSKLIVTDNINGNETLVKQVRNVINILKD